MMMEVQTKAVESADTRHLDVANDSYGDALAP